MYPYIHQASTWVITTITIKPSTNLLHAHIQTMISSALRCLLQLLIVLHFSVQQQHLVEAQDDDDDDDDDNDYWNHRLRVAKLDLWSRGAFALDENALFGGTSSKKEAVAQFEWLVTRRLGPIKRARRSTSSTSSQFSYSYPGTTTPWNIRGGDASSKMSLEQRIHVLAPTLGQGFQDAIEQNKKDHAHDCQLSCEMYYCANKPDSNTAPMDSILNSTTSIHSYSMGAVPPEDFADVFGFPLDLIKVTQGQPLFSAEEAARVIRNAESEGVDKNEYKSGKYRLGGDWLTNLPQTRDWFNHRLQVTFFPLLAHLFPEVVSSQSVLRAHSVSLLKYNSSHPRTDVHIDNGILALTLAMTPSREYTGGGTFFEHFDTVLPMDVGHGTFRPGSVRHGGHRVTQGTRYVLGAFLLIEDRVEHVRRLKNRGAELRRAGDLDGAERHFEWALALNSRCTTCLKDWAEILHLKRDFVQAERKIREALELLENKDSDALFTLGMLLSEQGKDDDSIAAYQQSFELNAEDAELLYNLGIRLGAKGKTKEEMQMYARATKVDPTFGGAWLNWGTSLAESGNMDDAELMFLKAVKCGGEVAPKAMVNLGLIQHTRANVLAPSGDLAGAKAAAMQATDYLEAAKPLLEDLLKQGKSDAAHYLSQYRPLRLQNYRMVGQIYAGTGDMDACEREFRRATDEFPNEQMAWQLLGRVLDIQGKGDEAKQVMAKLQQLRGE